LEAIVLKNFSIDISGMDDERYCDFVKKALYIEYREMEKWRGLISDFL
jgi:hypothetical protein